MGYAEVEQGVLDVVRKMADYGPANTSRGDYRVTAKGPSRAVVLRRENTSRAPVTMGRSYHRRTDWTVVAEVWVPWKGDEAELKKRLDAQAQAIADQVDRYPTLDGVAGVLDSEVFEIREPETWRDGREGWWKQDVVIRVSEIDSVGVA